MLVWIIMLGVWAIDRIFKVMILNHFMPGETLIVIPKVLHLTFVLNPGAAFGLLAGQTWFFVICALVFMAVIIYMQFRIPRDRRLMRLAMGMVGGGALGNLYDRLTMGEVVDYLDFQIWPYVFNFADSMIVVGTGLLILSMYWDEKRQQNE